MLPRCPQLLQKHKNGAFVLPRQRKKGRYPRTLGHLFCVTLRLISHRNLDL